MQATADALAMLKLLVPRLASVRESSRFWAVSSLNDCGLERDDLNDVKKLKVIGNTFMMRLLFTASRFCPKCCWSTA